MVKLDAIGEKIKTQKDLISEKKKADLEDESVSLMRQLDKLK